MRSISDRTEPAHRAIAYDRILESPFALPAGIATNAGEGTADIRIAVTADEPAPLKPEPIYRAEPDALTFSAPGVASYRCGDGEIRITPQPGSDFDAVTGLLIATALPAILWRAGAFILHAAAVQLPGHRDALAIAGPSGIGKSWLTAELIARGARLIADDTVCVRPGPEGATASGLAGGYHLAGPAGGRRDFHAVAPSQSLRRARLGAVIALSQHDGPDRPTLLEPIAAIERLLANQHRPKIPALLGRRAEILRFCAFLSKGVPIYDWRRRREELGLSDGDFETLTRCVRN